jgi:hypothetical protein
VLGISCGLPEEKRLGQCNRIGTALGLCCFLLSISIGHFSRPQSPTEVLGFSCGFFGEKRLGSAKVLVLLLVSAVFAVITIGHYKDLNRYRSAGIQLWYS